MTTKPKTSHTPGPWKWSGHFCTGIMTTVDCDPNVAIAHVSRDGGYITKEEAQANARLIAAAPDLLKATQRALTYIETEHSGEYQKEVEDALRVAITKAAY